MDSKLLEGLWNQASAKTIAKDGLLAEFREGAREMELSALPEFARRSRRADYGIEDLRAGISLDLWASAKPGGVLLDNRTPDGRGFSLRGIEGGAVELTLNDGRMESRWASDPGSIQPGKVQHIAVIVDGGPKIISFVIDGRLNDGGESRQFGWGRYNANLRSASGSPKVRIGEAVKGARVYGRALRTSEAVAAFRAGSAAR